VLLARLTDLLPAREHDRLPAALTSFADAGFGFHLLKPIDLAKLQAIQADAGTRRG
jgi:hypothetical protein